MPSIRGQYCAQSSKFKVHELSPRCDELRAAWLLSHGEELYRKQFSPRASHPFSTSSTLSLITPSTSDKGMEAETMCIQLPRESDVHATCTSVVHEHCGTSTTYYCSVLCNGRMEAECKRLCAYNFPVSHQQLTSCGKLYDIGQNTSSAVGVALHNILGRCGSLIVHIQCSGCGFT